MSEVLPTWDPLGISTPLPLKRKFFPLGFALEIETNSADILQAAETSWPDAIAPSGPRIDPSGPHHENPLCLRVVVSGSADSHALKTPQYRVQGNLLSVAADSANTAVCDIDSGMAACWLEPATAADHSHVRFHYLEGITYVLLSYKFLTPVHAGCVASPQTGRGILLNGPPGAGKSCLVYACARAGLTFVSDDVGYLLRSDPGSRVIGRPRFLRLRPSGAALFPELASYPPTIDAGGESIVEIEIDRLEGVAVTGECAEAQVVFLERRVNSEAAMRAVPVEQSLALLVRELNVMRDDIDRQHVETLQRLVQRGSYRLIYSDLDSAVERIKELLA